MKIDDQPHEARARLDVFEDGCRLFLFFSEDEDDNEPPGFEVTLPHQQVLDAAEQIKELRGGTERPRRTRR